MLQKGLYQSYPLVMQFNFEKKAVCTFDSVEFFCDKYSDILAFTPTNMDQLQEEFVAYQLLCESNIPQTIWKEALVFEDESTGVKHRIAAYTPQDFYVKPQDILAS